MPTHAHPHHHGHDDDRDPAHGAVPEVVGPGRPDPAQQALITALRSSFGVLRLVMIVLVVMYVASGVFNVRPGEQGLIVRLGKLQPGGEGGVVFEPGWHAALPDPFSRKIVLPAPNTPVQEPLVLNTFVFKEARAQPGVKLSELKNIASQNLLPGVDGAMLSGDKNLSHGRWVVRYRVTDAEQFVRNVAERTEPKATASTAEQARETTFRPLLERLTEEAVVREVSSRRVEEITREAVSDVALAVHGRLQQALDELKCGVTIDQVTADTIEPGGSVARAFEDVGAAEADRKKLIDEAVQSAAQTLNAVAGSQHRELLTRIEAYGAAQTRNEPQEKLAELLGAIDEELDQSQGEVARLLNSARSEASGILDQVRREYEEYRQYREQARRYPDLTRLQLWAEMRKIVFGAAENEFFFLPGQGDIEIWINRDPARLQELQTGAIQKRISGL